MALSKRLRFEVLRRDNHQCRYCGATAPDATLTVDHVVPVALGGSDEPSNLVAACRDCNAGKSSTSSDARVVDDVAQKAVRWADALKVAAREKLEVEGERRELWSWFNSVWIGVAEDYGLITQWYPNGPDVPPDWIDTIAKFLSAGLSKTLIVQMVATAMRSPASSRNKWRYFCGCCWNQIRDIQERAIELLETENGAE